LLDDIVALNSTYCFHFYNWLVFLRQPPQRWRSDRY
jgi:hypothetical protein